MKINAVLFDMDGVLVNSEEIMLKCAKSALLEWGIVACDSDFSEFVGAGEDRYIGGVAEKYGRKYDFAMKNRAYEIYGEEIKGQSIAIEGAKETIMELVDMGIKVAVCSSADDIKVKMNINAIGLDSNIFECIITGNMIKRKKPYPDIYIEASNRLDVVPCECIVVEDAINGIKAGHSAGMRCVAVPTSFDKKTLNNEAFPEIIIDNICELINIVKLANIK